MMYYCYLNTPVGDLLLAGDDKALSLVGFPKGKMRHDPDPDWIYNEKPFAAAREQLEEYFSGNRKDFDLPLNLSGTEFQVRVLEELQRIPYGETTSYGDIARRIGRPKAMRAVGAANGRNPIPIIIPCHRVIGSSGDLTGFGGGLDTKEALLRLEAENSELMKAL
ncbi:MAG: methylated-DNA--[protein]-cysteine S-methyltransferase [Gammaproteobacteria bacterium]|nr:methylated-DNA--[protein]-cysteine S-methyltransferase [Gammaproteobacteria bacterium]